MAHLNPYQKSVQLDAIAHRSGINWDYAVFATEDDVRAFAAWCYDNGYRTRNRFIDDENNFNIQYHTVQD